ncbi:DUF6241 domain-containing protein [Domibacillus sp. A3M-37]|uniref:DUF6241 domain-containing protein n=1 Tax=Domibacillus sp. A3M-37 TaxID=2962037 RepID=UPI0020B6C902|nr:DUF6241 domain-containing protein [Domibacillus sp. A3M-37]MCP3763276.1 DUF6241 domain-containing protein [Domibacillus sp. A3M-37]
MKKIIGWSVITGISGLMIGAGFLLSIEKEEASSVKDVSINTELIENATSDENVASDETVKMDTDLVDSVVADGTIKTKAAVTEGPEYKVNAESPEQRENRVLRESLLREQYAKEDGSFVRVVSLEGENTYVDGIIKNVEFIINYGKTETDAIRVMHLMTHQKVQAEQKWGAAPMTPTSTSRLVMALKKHPEYDPELLRVAEMWAANDFSEVDAQHNYLNTKLKATVEEGAATGVATPEEEKEFVQKYFDSSVAQELGYQ